MKFTTKGVSDKITAIRSGDKESIKAALWVMVAIIVASLLYILVFEVALKKQYKRPHASAASISSPSASLSQGFSEVFSSASGLMEIMSIKSNIDSLMQKENLTKADSIKLIRAFQQLEYLNRQSNKRSNEKN